MSSPFCEDILKASDVLCSNQGKLSSFRGHKGLIIIGTQSILTEVIIIIGCLIPPIQHQKHKETLTLP